MIPGLSLATMNQDDGGGSFERHNKMALWQEQEEDDFFGSEDDDSKPQRCTDGHDLDSGLAIAEASAATEHFRKLGYHEAYDATKDERIQEGFDKGYKDAFEVSSRIGESLGRATMQSKLAANGNRDRILNAANLIRSALTAPKRDSADSIETCKDLEDLKQSIQEKLI